MNPTAEIQMAGAKFLNPYIKLFLCIFGTSLIGYYLYESIIAGAKVDTIIVLRSLVLLGFIYLLIQSARDILKK